MGELIEKIVYYILGGVAGATAGYIIESFHFPLFQHADPMIVIIITSLMGIIVAILIVEYEIETTFRSNNEIRNETVALITHEMRTCLTSTGWAIQLVLQNYKDKINENDRKTLEDMVGSIHTTVMHSINLLDVSLLDIGKLAISLEWVSLADVEKNFKEIIEKYTFGAKQKGITLVADMTLDPARDMQVDTLRLRIILENLLENALQYTVRDEKKITVTVSNDSESMHLTVKDSGIGIPIGEQEKIFSEFYRASNARKQLSSGSGIGLYMCHQYVTSHGGTLRFESEENIGTTFFISIPLKTRADNNDFLKKI